MAITIAQNSAAFVGVTSVQIVCHMPRKHMPNIPSLVIV
jgi:hypothetical protein